MMELELRPHSLVELFKITNARLGGKGWVDICVVSVRPEMVDDWMDIERCAQLCNTTALSEEEDDELGRNKNIFLFCSSTTVCLSLG